MHRHAVSLGKAEARPRVLSRPSQSGGVVHALQRSAGNRATTRLLARKVRLDVTTKGLLAKAGRLDFEDDLKKAMPVANQHRAHVIAYDTLVRGVMDPINANCTSIRRAKCSSPPTTRE